MPVRRSRVFSQEVLPIGTNQNVETPRKVICDLLVGKTSHTVTSGGMQRTTRIVRLCTLIEVIKKYAKVANFHIAHPLRERSKLLESDHHIPLAATR
jgi:enolase